MALEVVEDVAGSDDIYPEYRPVWRLRIFRSCSKNARLFLESVKGFEDRETLPLHSTRYEFNYDPLPIGVSYWARFIETVLT